MSWTAASDGRLRSAVEHWGPGSWRLVALDVGGGRTASQCSARWRNHLRPGIDRSPVTHAERDRVIVRSNGGTVIRILRSGAAQRQIAPRHADVVGTVADRAAALSVGGALSPMVASSEATGANGSAPARECAAAAATRARTTTAPCVTIAQSLRPTTDGRDFERRALDRLTMAAIVSGLESDPVYETFRFLSFAELNDLIDIVSLL
jgi:hypothetical protein